MQTETGSRQASRSSRRSRSPRPSRPVAAARAHLGYEFRSPVRRDGAAGYGYRWSEPLCTTHTDAAAVTRNFGHIAFDRSLTITEVEEMQRTSGARVVEGPGITGIFGVTSVGTVAGQTTAESASPQMRVLPARRRVDPRVRWTQPLAENETPAEERAPAASGP